jgi:hypothetical protein
LTEKNQVWGNIRLKLVPYGRWDRVENPIVPGTPDVNGCVNGYEGWAELKLGGVEGARPAKLVLEQVLWIERQWLAGGRAWLLVLYERPRVWCMYDDIGTRELWERRSRAQPVLRAEGEFPTVDFLKVWTCR